MRSLRIVPNLRSSVVEEKPVDQALLFTSQLGDADAALLTGPDVRAFTWPRLLRAIADPELELLEVAEPLWFGEWWRALRYVVLAKLRPLLPGRRRVAVATYAIENLDARVRLGFPALDAWPVVGGAAARARTAAMGLSVRLLDVVVFGTSGAAENYRRAFGRALRRVRTAVMPPRIDACTVCGVVDAEREPTVLVLGAPSERKGFPVLMDAWRSSGAHERGWDLVVADPDGTGTPSPPPGVSVRTRPSREVVHALLRSSAVVAMPSVRRPRWREQIGLPLVEGLAHGCRVVTTTETGLAADLRDHPLVVLTTPGDVASLAGGLRRAIDTDRSAAEGSGYAGHTKRDVVDWWLGAARTRRRSVDVAPR